MQIYNETITDLLKPASSNLQLREDVTRGCFVDGLSEELVLNGNYLKVWIICIQSLSYAARLHF